MKLAEVVGKSRGGFTRGFRWDAVDFAAIASGQDQRFVKNAARPEFFSRLARLLGGERHTLANFDRSRAVVQSDEHNFHGADPVLPFNSGLWNQPTCLRVAQT